MNQVFERKGALKCSLAIVKYFFFNPEGYTKYDGLFKKVRKIEIKISIMKFCCY